jgi:hypothetical protein
MLWLRGFCRNWREVLLGSRDFVRFLFWRVPSKCVLIAEPNAFHGECLPGYVAYFEALGYQCVVLLRFANVADDPFCRFEHRPTCFCLTIWGMRKVLRMRKVKDFEYVLIGSSQSYLEEYRYWWRYLDFLGKLPEGKYGYGVIEHDFSRDAYGDFWDKQTEGSSYLEQMLQHTFMLTATPFRNTSIPMLNPHDFGMVKARKGFAGNKRIFITIGTVSANNRNFGAMFQAFDELSSVGKSFEVWIIGKIRSPELLTNRSYARAFGRVSFEEMYDRLEQSDFILPLLEPDTQRYYLEGCTSGTRQLIFGFKIVPVIHRAFAKRYGLDESACVAYEDSGLAEALGRALELDERQYVNCVEQLALARQRVWDESIANLQARIYA